MTLEQFILDYIGNHRSVTFGELTVLHTSRPCHAPHQ
jgi:hypothetical protein